MMSASLDYLIFLASTDCFAVPLFGDLTELDRKAIKHAARTLVPQITAGGDNYFLCADFSKSRQEATHNAFYVALANAGASSTGVARMRMNEEILREKNDVRSTAGFTISSIAARLFWLNTDSLKSVVTEDLLECMSAVEDVGLEVDDSTLEWKRRWSDANSEWDRYLKSLLDEVPETPYVTFCDLKESASQFNFLLNWKNRLGAVRFDSVRRFIEEEAAAELDGVNPSALIEVRRILDAL